jgi:hypothetical protein
METVTEDNTALPPPSQYRALVAEEETQALARTDTAETIPLPPSSPFPEQTQLTYSQTEEAKVSEEAPGRPPAPSPETQEALPVPAPLNLASLPPNIASTMDVVVMIVVCDRDSAKEYVDSLKERALVTPEEIQEAIAIDPDYAALLQHANIFSNQIIARWDSDQMQSPPSAKHLEAAVQLVECTKDIMKNKEPPQSPRKRSRADAISGSEEEIMSDEEMGPPPKRNSPKAAQ